MTIVKGNGNGQLEAIVKRCSKGRSVYDGHCLSAARLTRSDSNFYMASAAVLVSITWSSLRLNEGLRRHHGQYRSIGHM